MSSRVGSAPNSRLVGTLEKVVGRWANAAARSRLRSVRAVTTELALVVTDVSRVATDVVAVTLSDADGSSLPTWHPGAHIDLVLPSGAVRQYSLCGDPTDRATWRIAVRRIADGGGGSLEVHSLAVGTAVTARGPRNAFPFAYPHLAARDISTVAFVAGGIGITALLPMVREASRAGVPWSMTYVGRDRGSMPFLTELEGLTGGELRVLTGRPAMDEALWAVEARTSVYFCGPAPFLTAVRADLTSRPHAGFHYERFTPPPVVGGKPFTVWLAASERTVVVPADRSALSVIREGMSDVAYSCQQGFCGTCRVAVIEGQPDRRGTAKFLRDDASMLICVDRVDGARVTLDL